MRVSAVHCARSPVFPNVIVISDMHCNLQRTILMTVVIQLILNNCPYLITNALSELFLFVIIDGHGSIISSIPLCDS